MSTTTNTPTIAQKPRINTVTLVQLALLSALISVLASTPLGYINLGFISATTIHIPVILGAILFGPKAGAFSVIAILSIIYGPAYAQAQGLETDALFGAIMTVVGGVGVPEAIAAAVLSALIGRALLSIYKKAKLA